jgi:alanyl-tRNA synthetase
VDIVRDIAIEKGMTIDEQGFEVAMAAQRAQSKASWKGASLTELSEGVRDLLAQAQATEFKGYESVEGESSLQAIIGPAGELVDKAKAGEEVAFVCAGTPFYAESGGQCGDQGVLACGSGEARIIDTVKIGSGIFLHKGTVSTGEVRKGATVTLTVDNKRRRAICANHTATHLLQAALVQVLGDHVKQSGSQVTAQRLRFDFTNFSPMTAGEIAKVEAIVNEQIRLNNAMSTEHLSKDEAIQAGATALFGEKYGDKVRVVSVADYSKELCGGTHVKATGEIGLMKIVSETGIAAGIRRIEAITGEGALAQFQKDEAQLAQFAELLKSQPQELTDKLEKLLSRQKELEKEISQLNAKLSLSSLDSILDSGTEVAGVKVITATITLDSPKTMREIGDKIRDKMGSAIAVLGGELDGKVSLLTIVSKDLTKQFQAGAIIKEVAAIVGGSGGGRPDMAQAGGTMVDKLPEALNKVPEIVGKMAS